MSAVLAAFLALFTYSDDRQSALADRAAFPPTDQRYLYYSTVEHIDPEGRESAKIAFKLAMASASPAPVLEHCVPVDVTPTLMRFDTRLMQFQLHDWEAIAAADPYRQNPAAPFALCSGADWLTLRISDAKSFPGVYYSLVFGGTVPTDRNTALKILRVDQTPSLSVAMIEGASGIAVNQAHVRWLENWPISRGTAWGTRDMRQVLAHKDPLERLDGSFQHDGEEWIIHRRKISLRTRSEGALACYFLSDGAGKIVNAAPIDLVRDDTEFRGKPEIVAPGSCISCHTRGYNLPTENLLVKENLGPANLGGPDRFAKYHNQVEIESKLYANLEKLFKRGNEDYETAVVDGLGIKPVTAAASFQLCITRYDEPVTLATAARELYVTPEQLRQAIALESGRPGTTMTTRVAGLAHNLPMPREAFEEAWQGLWFILHKWEPVK